MPAVGNGHGVSKTSTSVTLRRNARNYDRSSRGCGRVADSSNGKAARRRSLAREDTVVAEGGKSVKAVPSRDPVIYNEPFPLWASAVMASTLLRLVAVKPALGSINRQRG